MSQQLINLSPDLSRLREEGYDIEVRAGHLIVKRIPYVDASGVVRDGTLAFVLETDGQRAIRPPDHTALFAGDPPCTAQGQSLPIVAGSGARVIDANLTIQHTFSCKPPQPYPDFYEKVVVYANQLSGHAEALDPSATPRPFLPVAASEQDGPFRYLDTASARAGITAVTQRLALPKVAIVGLGGTGAYVLDLVAKTPVAEIHLFDGDTFSAHNAFRAPGAASIDELAKRPSKVDYWKARYEPFRRGITANEIYITEQNADRLQGMTFVFLCMDRNKDKREIVALLGGAGIPFADCGMGLFQAEHDGTIGGILRTTIGTPAHPALARIPFSEENVDNVYATNIQVADLNALNAVLAVIRWKKMHSFYADLQGEVASHYMIDGNHLCNEG